MIEVDLIINSRWVAPVEPDDRVLENHSVVVNAGTIIELMPTSEVQAKYISKSSSTLDKHVIIPGLINSHTHAAMTLLRGLADDLPLMDWLQNHIWPTEQKWVCEEFVKAGSELAIAEMLRSGTTCFNDMYFFPDVTADAAIEAGIRAVVGLIVIDFPTAWAHDADEYLSKGEALHNKLQVNNLVSAALAPHAPYTVSDQPLIKIVEMADKLDIPIHMHIHETEHEVMDAEKDKGERPLARLHNLGVISSRLAAVHMTQLSTEEISLLEKQQATVVHNPESNLKLASGISPVKQLLDSGVNVALGTDGAASNNNLDMFGEMQTAALVAKVASSDATAVSAATALRMATINGAKALGIAGVTGSLEEGKSADIVAINLDDLATQPVYNPVSQLVYAASREQVSDVWVAGKQLLKSGELLTINKDKVIEQAKQWQVKISQQ